MPRRHSSGRRSLAGWLLVALLTALGARLAWVPPRAGGPSGRHLRSARSATASDAPEPRVGTASQGEGVDQKSADAVATYKTEGVPATQPSSEIDHRDTPQEEKEDQGRVDPPYDDSDLFLQNVDDREPIEATAEDSIVSLIEEASAVTTKARGKKTKGPKGESLEGDILALDAKVDRGAEAELDALVKPGQLSGRPKQFTLDLNVMGRMKKAYEEALIFLEEVKEGKDAMRTFFFWFTVACIAGICISILTMVKVGAIRLRGQDTNWGLRKDRTLLDDPSVKKWSYIRRMKELNTIVDGYAGPELPQPWEEGAPEGLPQGYL